MRKEETATGFDPGHEREGAQSVIEAHTRIRDFIQQQIKGVSFDDYGKLGKDGFNRLCSMRNDLVFSTSPEKMADGYPTLQEYGQRVVQWLWDKQSFSDGNGRKLNKAGQLLQDFLTQELGITGEPRKKTQEELQIERAMTEVHTEIRDRVKKGEVPAIDSDTLLDEIKRTAPEDRKYEKDLYSWLRKLTIEKKPGVSVESLKKSIPPEFQADLDYLLKQLAGHLTFEDVEEMIRRIRQDWRREKILHGIKQPVESETYQPLETSSLAEKVIVPDNTDEESEQKLKEEVLESLDRGEFPILKIKLEPVNDFKKLESGIKKAYAKKLKREESELFVEDASDISETLTTETRFLQDLFKTEYGGSPIPLKEMIPNDAPLQMIRISAKKQEGKNQTIWATVSLEGKNLVIKTFHGKVFSEQENPRMNLIPLESPTVDPILKKSGVSDSGRFKRQVEKTIHQPSENIDIVASEQGPIARVTIEKNGHTTYEWYHLGPMVDAA